MSNNKVDTRKLDKLQELTYRYNDELIKDPNFGENIRGRGGLVLLGDHYAASRKIYFGLNPGIVDPPNFYCGPISGNGPWEVNPKNGKSVKPEFSYWRNCSKFFTSDDDNYLYGWISDATSAFLVPWATRNKGELFGNISWLKVKACSAEIVRMMITHHEPRIIIVAGLTCRELLQEFLRCHELPIEWGMSPDRGNALYGKTNQYQWGRVQNVPAGQANRATVYMVPHFGRASHEGALKDCANWLSENIQKQWSHDIHTD